MYRPLFATAAAALLASAAPAAISFTYVSTSGDPLDSYSFSLPDDFTPATSDADTFTTGILTASGNTMYGPITFFDNFRFYADGGFDSDFDVYFGPTVFTGTTAAPMFINGSYTFDDYDNLGTLTISGAAEPASLAPEPASWALMLVGFGAIGGAMRGRRKAAVSFG